MILSDHDLGLLYESLIPNPQEQDRSLINPASIDIRIGWDYFFESEIGGMLHENIPEEGIFLAPGEFVLVSTFERIAVPNGYAVDLRLKSSIARKGFNHLLAFWVDPGWDGYLTMEIQNCLKFSALAIKPGMRFAQIIVHRLSSPAIKPYSGKYQNAKGVEASL